MRQGQPISDSQVQKIVRLLKDTDMSMATIAVAMGCTRSTVAKINGLHNVRAYGKRRSSWQQLWVDGRMETVTMRQSTSRPRRKGLGDG
jgi:hypothetical protein